MAQMIYKTVDPETLKEKVYEDYETLKDEVLQKDLYLRVTTYDKQAWQDYENADENDWITKIPEPQDTWMIWVEDKEIKEG